ncbi:sugar transporter [Neptunicoccus sediminis]|uniref:sugar transporter n=1 Tax=Neptunicoccus sediminis TaxID=1892596 RepID=UPI000AEABD91|nr:sugar transporter [Neptunicoccus sediminis]
MEDRNNRDAESDDASQDDQNADDQNGGGNNKPKKQRRQIKKLKQELREVQKAPPTVVVADVAPRARMKKRHYGVLLIFLFFVVLPSAGVFWYLYERAADQYASRIGFVVHTEDTSAVTDVLGGAIQLGSGGSKDTDILYEFIRSQQLVSLVDQKLDLRSLYAKPQNDPVFAFQQDGTIEDLLDYWSRMVRVYYDVDTQLIELRVQAFDPDDAYNIAQEIFAQSTVLVNRLSAVAREDTLRYAREELQTAEDQLKAARQALTRFRNETQIVDPSADVQGQMGLLNTLQAQLAAALIDQDILRDTTRDNDPRMVQAARKIEVIRKRIAEERQTFGLSGDGGGSNSEEFNALLAQFEALTVDREFAEKAWLAARSAYDGAVIEANRQSRYLAAYVGPTRAEKAQYPERIMLWVMTTLVLFLAWSILTLIGYSIKDRR